MEYKMPLHVHEDGKSAMVVFHVFSHNRAGVNVALPPGSGWQITAKFHDADTECGLFNESLVSPPQPNFSAAVILLSRD